MMSFFLKCHQLEHKLMKNKSTVEENCYKPVFNISKTAAVKPM